MSEDSMVLAEGRAIFELLDRTGGSASATDVQSHVVQVQGRGFNYRTARRMIQFFHYVRRRVENGQSIRPDKDVTTELADLIAYKTSSHWVEVRLMWYSQWRRDRAERERLDKARVERLLSRMWVPRFEDLLPFMLRGDGKLHAAELVGQPFKWLETDKETGQKAGVTRCWFSDEEDQWLRRTVTASALEADKARIIASYDQIQREVSAYFWSAARQRTSEEIDADLTVREVHAAFLGGSTSTSHPRFAELLGLALDPQDLRGAVINFVDEVRFVVGL